MIAIIRSLLVVASLIAGGTTAAAPLAAPADDAASVDTVARWNSPAAAESATEEVDRAVLTRLQPWFLQRATKDILPITEMSPAWLSDTHSDVNTSMRARRTLAWQITESVWQPVQTADGKVPTWMTWYEQEDIKRLFSELHKQGPGATPAEVSARVVALLNAHPSKDFQQSLDSGRFGRLLRQFDFPELRALNAHERPGSGTIYYSPAYVKHLLENAEKIANYDFSLPGQVHYKKRNANSESPDVNRFALSMDSEMPKNAVMIKVNWVRTENGASRWGMTADDLVEGFAKSPTGVFRPGGAVYTDHGGFFTVTDQNGQRWSLLGMHIASKVVRTWLWTTIVWGAYNNNGAWDSDQPPGLDRDWGLRRYGMVTVSDYREGDPAPWNVKAASPEQQMKLSATLKKLASAMNGVQWGANPWIEIGMSRTNCIGCHQGSPLHASPTTLTKVSTTNAADFAFSITTNREAFRIVLREPVLADFAEKKKNHEAVLGAVTGENDTVKAIGRVRVVGATATTPMSVCDAARAAKARSSPAAPGLEQQCVAGGGSLEAPPSIDVAQLDALAVAGGPIVDADPLLAALRVQQPEIAGQRGFDIGVAAAGQDTLPGPGKQHIHDSLGKDEQPGYDAAIAFSLERNRNKALATTGAAIAAQDPVVANARSADANVFYQLGFDIATGIFGDPALGAQGNTLIGPGSEKIRDSLSAAGQRGFNAAVTFNIARNYRQ